MPNLCAKLSPDAASTSVFDNVYDWERGTTAAQVEATVKLVGDRITRYIFLSSVAAYGDGLNHKESDPLAPDYHADPYVRHKATTERLLFRMHSQTGLPVVTFRPPFVYGPHNPFYREQFFWDRLRAGRPVIIPGDGHRLMQFAYVNDLVHAMIRSMDEPRAVGEAFNIGDTKPLTQVEVVEKLAKVANAEAVIWPAFRATSSRRPAAASWKSRTTSANTSICRPSPRISARSRAC